MVTVSRGVALNLLASALTILATIAFLGAATVVGESPQATLARTDTDAIVHRFYDALNAVLRTGETAPLDGAVSPDLLVHAGADGLTHERAGLERSLFTIRMSAPGMQLVLEDLTVAGDRAIVQLAQTSHTPGSFLGMPLAATPASRGHFDALLIRDGRVSELWSGLEHALVLEPLAQVRLDPLPGTDQAITLHRLSSPSSSVWTRGALYYPRVIYVDAGELALVVDATSPAAAAVFSTRAGDVAERTVLPGSSVTAQPGEALVFPLGTGQAFRHDPSPVDLLAYEIAFPRYHSLGPLQPGMTSPSFVGRPQQAVQPARELVTDAEQTGLPRDELVVSFGRITLPPGTSLRLNEAAGPLLLAVEAGGLDVASLQFDPERKETDPRAGETIDKRLAPGDGAIVPAGSVTTLAASSDEPVTVLVVSVLPSHDVPAAPP